MKYTCWDLWDMILNLFVVWIGSGDIARLPLSFSSFGPEVNSLRSHSSISQEAECITSISSVLPLAPRPKVMQRTQHRGGEEGTQPRCQSPAGMNAAQEGPEGSVSASPQNCSLHLEPTSSLHIWIHLFSIEISLFSLGFSEAGSHLCGPVWPLPPIFTLQVLRL